jgi:hypothetical protein
VFPVSLVTVHIPRRTGIDSQQSPGRAEADRARDQHDCPDHQRDTGSYRGQPGKGSDSEQRNSYDDPDRPFHSPYIACHDWTSLVGLKRSAISVQIQRLSADTDLAGYESSPRKWIQLLFGFAFDHFFG